MMVAQGKPRRDPLLPLAVRLKERIARVGPISVHDYMQACLADAHAGYYSTEALRKTLGELVDF